MPTGKCGTGAKEGDGKAIEETFRAHQVPMDMSKEEHLPLLDAWLRSYKPDELFTKDGKLIEELQALAPIGNQRMSANPHANGGQLLHDLRMPDFREYVLSLASPGATDAQDMILLGSFIRDIVKLNQETRNFRIFGPDETLSNRLSSVFEDTNRVWNADTYPLDEHLAFDGRVVASMPSHTLC